ncbi:hypothetical protein HPB50_000493 [Hyalomma asiaticum]|uniref:Uncharacterized protein n=1 Tax=Hyalomma asiaticum TaxID=266040 RepID=A0ACB7RNI7_HYAAI|nr:hypothetical protein HPB50_000493 [Hyalomma asiaticum]
MAGMTVEQAPEHKCSCKNALSRRQSVGGSYYNASILEAASRAAVVRESANNGGQRMKWTGPPPQSVPARLHLRSPRPSSGELFQYSSVQQHAASYGGKN